MHGDDGDFGRFPNHRYAGYGLQRLRAGFSGHAYDRHRHETYAIGFTEAGLQCFHYRGAARASTPGRVIVIHPDEAHDGHAGATGGFAYRMLYADPALIAEALGCRSLPFVSEPVIDDPALRRVIADAFADFPDPIEDLAIPSIVAALADALSRRAGSPAKTARFDNHNALDVARQLLLEASRTTISAPPRSRRRPASTASHWRAASACVSVPHRTAT